MTSSSCAVVTLLRRRLALLSSRFFVGRRLASSSSYDVIPRHRRATSSYIVFARRCHASLRVVVLYPVYTIELARRAGYMLAGRASSMFARSCALSSSSDKTDHCFLSKCSGKFCVIWITRYMLDNVTRIFRIFWWRCHGLAPKRQHPNVLLRTV